MNNKLDSIYESITKKQIIILFLGGGLLGAIVFLIIFGVAPLNVCNDSWLITGGDLSQHYLGWCYYRSSDWHFPLGMADGLQFPQQTCIIYTDSIPWLAFLFKLLSPLLPETFQYFGLWGIFTYILMGGISAVIIRKATPKLWVCIIASLFFSFSPYVMQRMFRHTSLGGQWILLLALLIIIYKPFFNTWRRRFAAWASLIFFGTMTHIYYAPMLAIFLFGFCLQDWLETKKFKENLLLGITSCIPGIAAMVLFGAFQVTSDLTDGGLGAYSANLNALWNPCGRQIGLLMRPLPIFPGQLEGFGYLGLGIILLAIAATVYLIIHRLGKKLESEPRKSILVRWSFPISMGFVVLVFLILAWSPIITYNDRELLFIHYPSKIWELLSIFRASGRFIWAVGYVIMFFGIMTVLRIKKFVIGIIGMFLCVTIQIVDLSPSIKSTREWMDSVVNAQSTLNSEQWEILGENYDHMVFIPYGYMAQNNNLLYTLAGYAKDYKMTLSFFPTARMNRGLLQQYEDNITQELSEGMYRDDTLYVFASEETAQKYGIDYVVIDGYIVGLGNGI